MGSSRDEVPGLRWVERAVPRLPFWKAGGFFVLPGTPTRLGTYLLIKADDITTRVSLDTSEALLSSQCVIKAFKCAS